MINLMMEHLIEQQEKAISLELDKMLFKYEPRTKDMTIDEKREFLKRNNMYFDSNQINIETTEYFLVKDDIKIAGISMTMDFSDMI